MQIKKIRVYITKADYEVAMKLADPKTIPTSPNYCSNCLVARAITRTCNKYNLLAGTILSITYSTAYWDNPIEGHICQAELPDVAKLAIVEYDLKHIFKTGRQFTLELQYKDEVF